MSRTHTVRLAHDIEQMDDIDQIKQLAQRMFNALNACRQQSGHIQQVLGGWIECKACEKANDECDGNLACDEMKAWQKTVDAARMP